MEKQALRPFSVKIKDIPGGFIIPVIILIVISFPPLFGHEIVGILVGAVWGLWIGFAIVAAGTFIGESTFPIRPLWRCCGLDDFRLIFLVGTWYAFKYAFRRKAIKLEKTNLNYGALARLTRDGGFWVRNSRLCENGLQMFTIILDHPSHSIFDHSFTSLYCGLFDMRR